MKGKEDAALGVLTRTFTDQRESVELAGTLPTTSISKDILVLDNDYNGPLADEQDASASESYSSRGISKSSSFRDYDSSISDGLTTFYNRGTSCSSASVTNYTHSHDLIDFLAVVQHRRLEILPFKWNPAADVGIGGTAKITQAATISFSDQNSVNHQIKFVVKRFQSEGARYQDRQKAYQGLLSEVYILGHPVVRQHPNINSVQGIAWDVIFNEAWPVLVFKMTEYGDLRQFMRTPEGRNLSLDEKVKLCWEIGNAIALMHSCYCIHGDIKPENILIFKDEDENFSAKVTDFGYSSIFAWENEALEIILARSWPWTAPEVEEDPRVTFEQAKSADTFSYGLICAWLLCYDTLPAGQSGKGGPDMEAFAALKGGPDLIREVTNSVRIYLQHNNAKSLAVISFLDMTLVYDYDRRDLKTPLENLGLPFGFTRRAPPLLEEYGKSALLKTNAAFNLVSMLSQLRLCGHEVRKSIFESFVRRAEAHADPEIVQKAAYELALSYYIGFGTDIDKTKSVSWLKMSNRSQDSIDDTVTMMTADTTSLYYTANHLVHYRVYQKARAKFFTPPSNLHDPSPNQELDTDEADLDLNALGEEVVSMEAIRYSLYKMMGFSYEGPDQWKLTARKKMPHAIQATFHGNFKNAPMVIGEPLKITITPENPKTMQDHINAVLKGMETKARIIGPEHEDTIREMNTLCHLYCECKRWDDAEPLIISIMNTQRDILGPENPVTLRSMERLAKILLEKQSWKEAEDLVLEIVNIRLGISRAQVEQNQNSLNILLDLIRAYAANGMNEAMELPSKKLLEVFRAGAGERTELILLAMLQLARQFAKTRKCEEAKSLLKELIEEADGFYGKDTLQAIEVKQLLATVYISQSVEKPDMFAEAHQLLLEVRNSLSKLDASRPPPTKKPCVHKVDADELRKTTETLWTFLSENIDTSSNIDAVKTTEEALENLPDDSPDRTDVLAALGEALVVRFNLLGDPDDLDAGIMWAEQALLILSEEHPKRAQRLADLGSAIWHRYQLTSSPSDLETSVRYAEDSVLLTEDGDNELTARLQVLVARLDERHEKYEDIEDLNKAIVFVEQLLFSISSSDGIYGWWIYKLSSWYQRKWKYFNEMSDLDEAINALERLGPAKDTMKKATLVSLYADLAKLYGDRSSVLHTDDDLDKAIAKLEECLKLAGTADPDELESRGCGYGSMAADLALLYLIRFNRSNNVGDLTNAKERIEVADALVALESREREKVEGTRIIIRRICDRVERGGEWRQGIL